MVGSLLCRKVHQVQTGYLGLEIIVKKPTDIVDQWVFGVFRKFRNQFSNAKSECLCDVPASVLTLMLQIFGTVLCPEAMIGQPAQGFNHLHNCCGGRKGYWRNPVGERRKYCSAERPSKRAPRLSALQA
jgi:hypothetical protein